MAATTVKSGKIDSIKSTQQSSETATQTSQLDDDDDSSGQLYYIPLQAVTRNGSGQGGQQLIQGVAVKLATDKPTGANHRVLLEAKLVTKQPTSIARCLPIGTVQPTARTPQIVQPEVPSTSTANVIDNFKVNYHNNCSIKKITSAGESNPECNHHLRCRFVSLLRECIIQ